LQQLFKHIQIFFTWWPIIYYCKIFQTILIYYDNLLGHFCD
jgi:hypothetical protein